MGTLAPKLSESKNTEGHCTEKRVSEGWGEGREAGRPVRRGGHCYCPGGDRRWLGPVSSGFKKPLMLTPCHSQLSSQKSFFFN